MDSLFKAEQAELFVMYIPAKCDVLQLEKFKKAGQSEFSDTSDDVNQFFTPAIWMGLLVTWTMLIILGLGLTMLMDIKTMDRFDDPKGKTITVNVSE